MTIETFAIDDRGRASMAKDPSDVLDYVFDFTAQMDLDVDSITSAVAVADAASGCAIEATSITDAKQVSVWVSGGSAGMRATITCTIETAGGRTYQRSLYLKIKDL